MTDNTIDLDLLGDIEHVLTFEAFKLKMPYMIKEMASKSIDLEPRPNRMKKPPEFRSVATNPTSYFPNLYIQDEMRDMLIDKYGKEKGERQFDGLLNASRHGAFFQQGGILAAEKAWLIETLGKNARGDYWAFSYYEMWKEWMASINQPINIAPTEKPSTRVAPPVEVVPAPVVNRQAPASNDISGSITNAFNALSGKGASGPEKAKSKERVRNILNGANKYTAARKMVNATSEVYKLVQRAYYAMELGDIEIAKLFWSKAVSMGVRESNGTFTGLDYIKERADNVGDESWNYHLCNDGGCSTEWDIPLKLSIGTVFTHSFGEFKVDSYEGDNEIICNKVS